MFTTVSKNAMLDATQLGSASLHSSFPGQTGLNEITGGSPAYARKATTVGAASGEQRTLSSSVAFDVPASTVRWVGFWNNAQSQFQAYAPNGGSPKEFVVDLTANTIRSPSHGYADAQKIVFYNGTVPGALTEATVYYVRDVSGDTFKVAASAGGAAITITSAGSSACLVSTIVEDVYASQGTHTITSVPFSLGL